MLWDLGEEPAHYFFIGSVITFLPITKSTRAEDQGGRVRMDVGVQVPLAHQLCPSLFSVVRNYGAYTSRG